MNLLELARTVLAVVRLVGAWSLTHLADLLSPPGCASCDAPVGRGVLCAPCAATVVPATPLGPYRAVGLHGGALADAARRLKYDRRPDLAPRLGALMAAEVEPGSVDRVVPVPLHPRRLAERGYNQSALLARPVARAVGAPLDTRSLVRHAHRGPQAALGRVERLRNVVGAFEVRRPRSVRGQRVLLVDDVTTTGATLEACALALLEAGARSVTAVTLTVARPAGEPPSARGAEVG